ncbi:hypothetical protein TNCV_2739211 [Trichonephila clavipes]|nr:hypothetical protein TNCV_2739211 [Trichonephila clavipes]
MRVPYRSHQNNRLRLMLVLVHILDITPPHTPVPVFRRIEVTIEGRKEGSFWVPSVPNECEYLTDHTKTIVFD